jgi:hypothetical protein
MKAGDEIYDGDLPDERGELEQFLAGALLAVFEDYQTERFSNGDVADALFLALDLLVTTEEQRERMREYGVDYYLANEE